ncbi:MAG TPA: AbrB/MazE/SpoVT family DNA-binding domain-containing protein [Hyphomicrobiales bacterium]|nr:AbrB/MazE/SpoVT family DNA-binding domain-containing protein [Hyphomicrobiales bacterium]
MNSVIRKIGNSEGVIIPKDLLERLGLRAGDNVVLLADQGEIRLRPLVDSAQNFEARMKVARERMKKYEVALRELAK